MMGLLTLALLTFQGVPREDEGKTVVRAVDRLTERLTVLKGRTQVVWLVDNSASMADDRKAIAGQINRIFENIPEGNRLAMSVAPFSDRLGRPTDFLERPDRVREALLRIKGGGSGRERVFSAVAEAATWFTGRGHQILVILTDEQGDDRDRLEEVIELVRSQRVQVFVIGPPTPFQWPVRFHPDPENDRIVPTNSGFESPGFEVIALNPICCAQAGRQGYGEVYPRCRKMLVEPSIARLDPPHDLRNPLGCDLLFDDAVTSGTGPWALSRLAWRTGGEYIPLGPRLPEEYLPDRSARTEYERANRRDRLRKAVVGVVAELHRGGPFGLAATGPLPLAPDQPRAAERLDRKCIQWIETLRKAPPGSKRWEANRDLVIAQLLTLRHYLREYALAFREDLPSLTGSHYSVQPGDPRGDRADPARKALDRVIERHPNTPWAETAGRLKERLGGFRVCGWTPSSRPIHPPAPR